MIDTCVSNKQIVNIEMNQDGKTAELLHQLESEALGKVNKTVYQHVDDIDVQFVALEFHRDHLTMKVLTLFLFKINNVEHEIRFSTDEPFIQDTDAMIRVFKHEFAQALMSELFNITPRDKQNELVNMVLSNRM